MIELQFPPSVWILFGSAAISAVLSYLVWQRRPGKAILPFVVLMVAVTFWALGNAFEQIAVELHHKLIFSRTNYIWITTVPAASTSIVVTIGPSPIPATPSFNSMHS